MARGMEMVRVVDDGVITTGKVKKKKKKSPNAGDEQVC